MNNYNVQTQVRVTGTFKDTGSTLADPTTVTLTITPPGKPAYSVTPVRDGVGVYHHDVLIDATGIWEYQWQGEGTLIAASPVNLIQVF